MINFAKALKTRSGRDVKIYSTDNGGPFPIHGAYLSKVGQWTIGTWTKEGKVIALEGSQHTLDLVNAPRSIKATRWIKIMATGADGSQRTFGTQLYNAKPIGKYDFLEVQLEWTEPMEGEPAPGDQIVNIDEEGD